MFDECRRSICRSTGSSRKVVMRVTDLSSCLAVEFEVNFAMFRLTWRQAFSEASCFERSHVVLLLEPLKFSRRELQENVLVTSARLEYFQG